MLSVRLQDGANRNPDRVKCHDSADPTGGPELHEPVDIQSTHHLNGDGVAVLEPDRNGEVAVAFRLAQ